MTESLFVLRGRKQIEDGKTVAVLGFLDYPGQFEVPVGLVPDKAAPEDIVRVRVRVARHMSKEALIGG